MVMVLWVHTYTLSMYNILFVKGGGREGRKTEELDLMGKEVAEQ